VEKKPAKVVEQVQKDYPDADVEVWTMDEQRLGLKPLLRDVWVPEGEQPIANVNWRFQWLCGAGAAPPPGSMVLSIHNQEKLIGGFCPKRSRRRSASGQYQAIQSRVS